MHMTGKEGMAISPSLGFLIYKVRLTAISPFRVVKETEELTATRLVSRDSEMGEPFIVDLCP